MKARLLALVLLVSVSGCAVPASIGGRSTAQLTTPGIVALHGLEVVKALDVLRDLAIDGEAAKIIATSDARQIVTVYRSVLLSLKELPGGWKVTVLTALTQLARDLSPSARAQAGPYIDSAVLLIKAVL